MRLFGAQLLYPLVFMASVFLLLSLHVSRSAIVQKITHIFALLTWNVSDAPIDLMICRRLFSFTTMGAHLPACGPIICHVRPGCKPGDIKPNAI